MFNFSNILISNWEKIFKNVKPVKIISIITNEMERLNGIDFTYFYNCPIHVIGGWAKCIERVKEDNNYFHIYEDCYDLLGGFNTFYCTKIPKRIEYTIESGFNYPNITFIIYPKESYIPLNSKYFTIRLIGINIQDDRIVKGLTSWVYADKNYTVIIFFKSIPIAILNISTSIHNQVIPITINGYLLKSYKGNKIVIGDVNVKNLKVENLNKNFPYSNMLITFNTTKPSCLILTKPLDAKVNISINTFHAINISRKYITICTIPKSKVKIKVIDMYYLNITYVDTLGNVLYSNSSLKHVNTYSIKIPLKFKDFQFYKWEDGYINNVRKITLTRSINLTAIFKVPTYFKYVDVVRYSRNRIVIEGFLIDYYGNYLNNAIVNVKILNESKVFNVTTVNGYFKIETRLSKDILPTVELYYGGNETYVSIKMIVKARYGLEYFISPILPILAILIAIILVIYIIKKKRKTM